MYRTNNTFSLLQAITAVVTLAIILWFAGATAFKAEAANVISFSNTLSDSEPGVVSNHTLSFVTPTGLVAGNSISIDFGTAIFGNIDSLDEGDVDLNIAGVEKTLAASASGATWGVSAAGSVVTITSGTDVIGTNATVTIEIGTNATTGGTGVHRILNPAVGSYEIIVDLEGSDTGATRVAIVNVVTVTAAVETIFNFTVTGVNADQGVNTATTTSTSTPTAIPFGILALDTPATAAQDLQVSTNAANGFVVTVQTDHQLLSATGADIDGFADGAYTTSPIAWASPTKAIGNENTYGHWGLTSDDTGYFGSAEYASASTTPVEIFSHNGPVDGAEAGVGITRVGYTVEITALQEAGDDYTATLTYVATPVF